MRPEFGFYIEHKDGVIRLFDTSCDLDPIVVMKLNDTVEQDGWKLFSWDHVNLFVSRGDSFKALIKLTSETYYPLDYHNDSNRIATFVGIFYFACLAFTIYSVVTMAHPVQSVKALSVGDTLQYGQCLADYHNDSAPGLCVTYAGVLMYGDRVIATGGTRLLFSSDSTLHFGDWTSHKPFKSVSVEHEIVLQSGFLTLLHDWPTTRIVPLIPFTPTNVGTQLLHDQALLPGQYLTSEKLQIGVLPVKFGNNCVISEVTPGESVHRQVAIAPGDNACKAYIGYYNGFTLRKGLQHPEATHMSITDTKLISWKGGLQI
jgi:hypothetical protein